MATRQVPERSHPRRRDLRLLGHRWTVLECGRPVPALPTPRDREQHARRLSLDSAMRTAIADVERALPDVRVVRAEIDRTELDAPTACVARLTDGSPRGCACAPSAKSPIDTEMASPPGLSRSLATIFSEASMPSTSKPRSASGSPIRRVPTPSSRMRRSDARSASVFQGLRRCATTDRRPYPLVVHVSPRVADPTRIIDVHSPSDAIRTVARPPGDGRRSPVLQSISSSRSAGEAGSTRVAAEQPGPCVSPVIHSRS